MKGASRAFEQIGENCFMFVKPSVDNGMRLR
jgi:hypothetical protein